MSVWGMCIFLKSCKGDAMVENVNLDREEWQVERLERFHEAVAAFESAPKEQPISDMLVIVPYKARIKRVEHYTRAGQHVFHFTSQAQETSTGEQGREIPEAIKALLDPYRVDDSAFMESEKLPRNAHEVLKEFLSIRDWIAAHDFLSNTGVFSPLSDTITYREFERWQRFASLVQEHTPLAAATNEAQWSGECAEVLKALTGEPIFFSCSFFDGTEIPPSPAATETDALIRRKNPVMISEKIQLWRRLQARRRIEICSWFRQPPCSVEWIPSNEEAEQRALQHLQNRGFGPWMMEFMLPKMELKPVIVIRPTYTLQAIAAAIYADRIHGVEWKKCAWEKCPEIFRVGSHKNRKYCGRDSCKNNAHSQELRNRLKDKAK